MAEPREYRFEIDAYTAETMPLGRLTKYLHELAAVLGDDRYIHLLRVDDGSTVPVMRVDAEAAERVNRRAAEVRSGIAPRDAMQGYRNLNKLLAQDDGQAVLIECMPEGGAEIIPFPGQEEQTTGIQQQGSLDGTLEKVGGSRDWVPLILKTMEEETITGCYAKRNTAKELGHYLFEPIRLYGRGRWRRTKEGRWILERFIVDNFEKLSDEPLPSVISELRVKAVNWSNSPIADIQALREEDE